MKEIRVNVVDYGRAALYMRFRDPVTGKLVTKSTGTSDPKKARDAAAVWAADLREGRYVTPSKVTWEEFRNRYEAEHVPGKAANTAGKVQAVFNSVETLINPERLATLNEAEISRWQSKLRAAGRAEATIKSYSGTLKAALNWASEIGLLVRVPKIRMPTRAKGQKVMKGRPVTGEEFERMLAAIPKVVGQRRAESWTFLVRGLWWSGLRITEALSLRWDGHGLRVDLSGKRPMLRIPAGSEKGNRERLLPLAPEAAEMLLAVPESQRSGFVFNPAHKFTAKPRAGRMTVIRAISRIGEKAGVKVNTTMKRKAEVVKWASAHDLRRAFGERWAQRVMPPVLQQMMRHESIETTMRFYVGRDAQATAELLYSVSGNSSGNSDQQPTQEHSEDAAQVVAS